MSEPVVVFDGVWKKFRRGERHDSLRDLIPAMVRACRPRREPGLAAEEFWAVEDVSFDVAAGEALGVIGPNGAGKSTTLKLLTKILRPTRGRSVIRGRVGALIEIAAGFHPDLTGRENVYMQGAIMQMRRNEIARKFDDIVAFAGVQAFIDTPVKRYSSGMYARLGFSIAAHLQPDALLIDEVLAVGDMAFQQRCIERMREFKRQGVAIIFVSHNLQAVADLCTRVLCLQRRAVGLGPAREVIETYVRRTERDRTSTGTGAVEVVAAELEDEQGAVTSVFPGARLTLRVTYEAREAIEDLHLGFVLYRSSDRLIVYDGGSALKICSLAANERVVAEFAFRAHLTRGQYDLGCYACHNPTQRVVGELCPARILSVSEQRSHGGVADLEVEASLVHRAGEARGRAGEFATQRS
jgi:ABC-type polysaccharide/polyol phosphate transport system ATPase subunit